MENLSHEFPGLPLDGSNRRGSEAQVAVMDFLMHRPAGNEWAYPADIYDGVRESHPKLGFGHVYVDAIQRLTRHGYLEMKLGEPQYPGSQHMRKLYRAVSNGARVSNESRKEPSREPLFQPQLNPTPGFA